MTHRCAIWVHSARPKTLPASVAPVFIGTAMAYAEGYMSVWVTLATLLAAILIQIGTNYANDYYDFVKGTDRSDRVGPTRATAAGLVTPYQMRNAMIGVFGAAAVLGACLALVGGWPIAVIGAVSILCGIAYTAGPYPLGYVGLGDVFVLIFFGPVAVGGTYYLLAHTIDTVVILAGLAPGLISTAVLVVNNYRDRYTDQVTGKNTLVVRFGPRFGRLEYAVTLLGGCLIPVLLTIMDQGRIACLLASASVFFGIALVRRVYGDVSAKQLNHMLAQTGQVLVLYSILFMIGWQL